MQKKISAIKARNQLGRVMNEVSIMNDDYIIERAGKPVVVVISIEKYKKMETEKQKAKDSFFNRVENIREKAKGVDPKELDKVIKEALTASRKH